MPDKRKNAIWIFGDQHPAYALSCNGDPNLNTPNLDRLAAQGRYFSKAHVTVAVCQPSRQSMLTGLYPPNNGALGFFPSMKMCPL